jgi:hypothetical protein
MKASCTNSAPRSLLGLAAAITSSRISSPFMVLCRTLTFQTWLIYSLKMDEKVLTTCQNKSPHAVCLATPTASRKEKLMQCSKRVMPATLLSAGIWFPKCISRLSESRVEISDSHNLLGWQKMAEGFIFYNKPMTAKETVGRDKTCYILQNSRQRGSMNDLGYVRVVRIHAIPMYS